jgi:hypothetical protein
MKGASWYASGGGITKTGPFKTQRQAYEAMRLAPDRIVGGCPYPRDLFIWPEWEKSGDNSQVRAGDRKRQRSNAE